jgi:hypothetical protein
MVHSHRLRRDCQYNRLPYQFARDNQRLTAEGKLGEAGQKLEQLKRKLDQLTALQK